MTSAIGSINAGASAPAFDPSKAAARIASKVFSDLDADKDGKLNKTEFVSGLEAKGVSADDAAKQFDAIDTQMTGSITQSDLETAVKDGKFGPKAGSRPEGGGRAEGAGRHAGAGGAGGAGSAGSSAKTYEAADTNKDGTVSDQEQLVYNISHPAAAATATSTDATKLGTNVDQLA